MEEIKKLISRTYLDIAEELGCSVAVIRNQTKNIKHENPDRWERSTKRNGKSVIVVDPDLVEELRRRVRPGQKTAKTQVIAMERQIQQLQQSNQQLAQALAQQMQDLAAMRAERDTALQRAGTLETEVQGSRHTQTLQEARIEAQEAEIQRLKEELSAYTEHSFFGFKWATKQKKQ